MMTISSNNHSPGQIAPELIEQLSRRYPATGPRYTSYPTAIEFKDSFGESELIQSLEISNSQMIPSSLSLYLHLPFCSHLCFYCGCNKVVTRNQDKAAHYLDYLFREIEMYGGLLDSDRTVQQLHLGGGTPTFYGVSQIRQIIETLDRHFTLAFNPGRDYSIEIDPRTVDRVYMRGLANLGFNRISIGVQDFDPEVQKAVHRIQSDKEVKDLMEQARQSGIDSINLDLIYGLPRQTAESFGNTLTRVIDCSPDRISVYNYAHLPDRFPPQRRINESELPTVQTRMDLQRLTIEMLSAAGYVYIGMDHFARPDDPLVVAMHDGTLHRSFQGYTTHMQCELIGIGVSSIGEIGNCLYQNEKTLDEYYLALDQERLPISRGIALSEDDRIRQHVIMTIMCCGRIDKKEFESSTGYLFDKYFSGESAALEKIGSDGLVNVGDQYIDVTETGRFMLRNIAMIFDRYRHHTEHGNRFSKTV